MSLALLPHQRPNPLQPKVRDDPYPYHKERAREQQLEHDAGRLGNEGGARQVEPYGRYFHKQHGRDCVAVSHLAACAHHNDQGRGVEEKVAAKINGLEDVAQAVSQGDGGEDAMEAGER